MRKFLYLFLILLAALAAPVSAQKKEAPTPAPPASVLPADFSGWHKVPQRGVLLAGSDPKILNEYGVKTMEAAQYERGDRKIMVKAFGFADATGAYGAFTFYRTSEMATEKFCD